MERKTLKLSLRPRWVTGLVENVQEYFRRETGVEYPHAVVERSLEQWIESRVDGMLERLGEVITSPHLAEAQEFRRILEQNAVGSELQISSSGPIPAAEAAIAGRDACASGETIVDA